MKTTKRSTMLIAALAAALLAGLGIVPSACSTTDSSSQVSVAAVTTTAPSETQGSDSHDAPSYDTTTTYQSVDDSGARYTATDTSYTSETTSISITTVSTGSGRSALTYYVADLQLAPGTILQSAFADGFESGNVDYTSAIAGANGAVLAVNGDYCTARNTGIIIRSGVLYLDAPARMGLALYKDGSMRVYDETEISAEQLLADGVWNTFSFGPALLVDGAIPEGLDTTEVEDIGEEHTILGSQPRTGVGVVDTGHYVFIVVDGRSQGYSMGVTLSEFAQIFRDLGCTTAYNLDGGGSSAMYFMGELVNDPLGEGRERGISDILYVR